MAYLNITNPLDPNKKPWVQINKIASKEKMSRESKLTKDINGLFAEVMAGEKNVDAGILQEELLAAGVPVSSSPEMAPNGVTVSSAGILIAIDGAVTKEIVQLAEAAVVAAMSRRFDNTPPETPLETKSKEKSRDVL